MKNLQKSMSTIKRLWSKLSITCFPSASKQRLQNLQTIANNLLKQKQNIESENGMAMIFLFTPFILFSKVFANNWSFCRAPSPIPDRKEFQKSELSRMRHIFIFQIEKSQWRKQSCHHRKPNCRNQLFHDRQTECDSYNITKLFHAFGVTK